MRKAKTVAEQMDPKVDQVAAELGGEVARSRIADAAAVGERVARVAEIACPDTDDVHQRHGHLRRHAEVCHQ